MLRRLVSLMCERGFISYEGDNFSAIQLITPLQSWFKKKMFDPIQIVKIKHKSNIEINFVLVHLMCIACAEFVISTHQAA